MSDVAVTWPAVITVLAQAAHAATSGGWTELTVVVLLAVVWFAVRAQLNPFTRCNVCEGKAPGDGEGNYRRCRRCGGAAERLRFGAWVQRRVGIPVPRARESEKKNRWGL